MSIPVHKRSMSTDTHSSSKLLLVLLLLHATQLAVPACRRDTPTPAAGQAMPHDG